MRGRKLLFGCVGAALLTIGCYAAFRIGQVTASREGMRNLAFVSLWAVEPAVRVSELEAEKPGLLPKALVVSSEDSIAMVAQFSIMFDPNLENLATDQRNVLCVIAKDRERHRAFHAPSLVYDDHLMAHLEKIYKATAKEASDSAAASGRVACSLSAGKAGVNR